MKTQFLLDENLSPRFKSAILRFNPEIDVLRVGLRVGDPGAPSLGTQDPEILHYLETSKRLLVTDNRKSIPGHLEEYWAAGGHIWGLFWLRPYATMGEWAEELFAVWEASDAEEWIDIVDWIPF
ncbi:MAG: DUF5615 family PIN-like protein [Cyanobacteriota bacterium]|nr:DUF5615 family PIN-like protein [Cyanobacteriota bacterium]